MKLSHVSFSHVAAALLFAASAPVLHADVVATDNDVNRIMDVGGTSSNRAEYILGAAPGFTKAYSAVWVGQYTGYNALIVQSGAEITTSGDLMIGVRTGSDYNSVLVTGSSTMDLGGNYLRLGIQGENNTFRVEGGSQITGVSQAFINDGIGNNNSLTISGFGSSLYATELVVIGNYGITSGASLTLENSGLLKIDANYWSGLSIAGDNYLQFNGGYLAWKGDWAEAINYQADSGYYKAWNGTEFISITSAEVKLRYFATDAAGLAATGIDGLGGYTVAEAVPEPGTWALIALGALGVGLRRRFKKG